MADVLDFSKKHFKLFPRVANKLVANIKDEEGCFYEGYVGLYVCVLCKKDGTINPQGNPFVKVYCPACHGFGYVLKFLRHEQVEPIPPTNLPTEDPKP